MQIFDYNNLSVRTVVLDGEPWFVLKDICAVLQLDSSHKVAGRLEEDEINQISIIAPHGREQNTTIISESGMYSVILRSTKVQAKAFRRWVTGEVLPSIRKHSTYMAPETLEAALLNPDYLIRLAVTLKEEMEKRKKAESENKLLRPKAEYFDELVDGNLLTNFRDTAKEFGINQTDFVNLLLEKKYVFRDSGGTLKPYSKYVADALFEVKERRAKTGPWVGT